MRAQPRAAWNVEVLLLMPFKAWAEVDMEYKR
jgi:hypothetical protein